MADFTERLSEVMCPLDHHHPILVSRAGAYVSNYVDLSNYHRAWVLINVGVLGQATTLDATLQQATDTTGANAKAIAGKTITQLTQAGGDGDQILCIELRGEEMDGAGAFDCIGLAFTLQGTAYLSYWIFGCVPRFDEVPVTAWEEIVD